MRSKEKPIVEDTKLFINNLEKLTPKLMEDYLDFNSSKICSLGSRKIDVV